MKFKAPAKENHYALWDWLAKNPKKDKINWPGWETIDKLGIDWPENNCFPCNLYFDKDCKKCPLLIANNVYCANDGHPFDRWLHSYNPEKRTKYAIQIRDMWK